MNIKKPIKSNHEEFCENRNTLKNHIYLLLKYIFGFYIVSHSAYLPQLLFFPSWVIFFLVCMGLSMCMHVCTCVWVCMHAWVHGKHIRVVWLSIDPQASACLRSASIRITRVYHSSALYVNTGDRTQVFMLVRTFLNEQAQSSDPLFLLCWSSNSHPLWCLWFLKLNVSLLWLSALPNVSLY